MSNNFKKKYSSSGYPYACLLKVFILLLIPNHFKKSINYIPHITLGQAHNLDSFSNFNYEFTTIIDEISVGFIDEYEESIVISNIKLKK